MAILDKVLVGKFINMRSVTEADSEFIVKLRSDPEKYKNNAIHPPISGYGVEMQNKWLRKQQSTEGDYYFIYEDKTGKKLGTCGICNVEGNECEVCRWVSYGDSVQNVESQILNYDFVFNELKIDKVHFAVTRENIAVISFHKKFGAKYIEDIVFDNIPSIKMELTKEMYEEARKKILRMLARVSI